MHDDFFFSPSIPPFFCPFCHCGPQSNYQLMNVGLFFQSLPPSLHLSCSPLEDADRETKFHILAFQTYGIQDVFSDQEEH